MNEFSATRREIFFNNLIMLGLDQAATEKKYGIPINKDMFVVPNRKGSEIITYFLFSKLSATTGKDYNIPWPLVSTDLARLFQKTCYSHLSNFSQEEGVKFPRIVPSLLSSFGGDRFHKLYLAFSSYVLKKEIEKNANTNTLSRPVVTEGNFNVVKDIVQLSTISKKEKFVNFVAAAHQNDLVWIQYAKNLSKCLRKLKEILEANKELIRSKHRIVSRLDIAVPGETLEVEKLVENSVVLWKPTGGQRKNVQQFFTTEENLWQCLASEVDENTEDCVLSAKDIRKDIAILEELCGESEKVGISCSEEDGQISVIRFLNLLMAGLKPITEILKKNMCNIPETIFLNEGFPLEHDLNSVQNLINKLSKDTIPRLEDSIEKLKSAQSLEHIEETSESMFCAICSLPNLSYKPEAVKARALFDDPELEEKLQINISREIANNSVSSAHLSVSHSLSDAEASVANLTSLHGPQLRVPHFADASLFQKVALINSFKQKLDTETKKDTSVSLKENGEPSGSRLLRNLELSDLDDLDLAPATHFRMRDSWHNVESLLAETLPDMSFED